MASVIERSRIAAKKRKEAKEKSKTKKASGQKGKQALPAKAKAAKDAKAKRNKRLSAEQEALFGTDPTKIRETGTRRPGAKGKQLSKLSKSGAAKSGGSKVVARPGKDAAKPVAKPGKPKQTFGQAFAAARKDKGAGKTFTWNGKSYSTNRADDKPNKPRGGAAPARAASEPSFFGKMMANTGKPNKRRFQRGARMTPGERRKYESAMKRWESKKKK